MRTGLAMMIMALCLAANAQAASWTVDVAASHIAFSGTFEGNPFSGRFTGISGTAVFDPETPTTGRFDIRVDVTTADAGSGDVNDALATAEWFDYARYPLARFVSDAVEAAPSSDFQTRGQLTIKGISRQVSLPFRFDPEDNRATLTSTTELRRTDFAIGTGEWESGASVSLAIQVEATIVLRRTD